MLNYDEMIRLGERLQLSGDNLAKFICQKEEEYYAREERALRREEERRESERQHQIRLNEQQIELQRLKAQGTKTEAFGARPKLPKFEEGKDDMDAYVERFERFSKGQEWSSETWATCLSSLLTGKGLEVYTSLPPEEANDYKILKTAILKRYQLTEEGFRTKFRSSKQENGESVLQFVARLRRYFNRWIEMANANDSVVSLCDLMIKEQFMLSCSTDLALFLKERAPKSVVEMTCLAEQYVEAHGDRMITERPPSARPKNSSGETKIQGINNSTRDNNRNANLCFICNRSGHFAKDCWQNQSRELSTREKRIGAICTNPEQNAEPGNVVEGRLKLRNGDSLPIMSAGCTIETLSGERNLDLQPGRVGQREVNVRRDTGCELAAVRKEFVMQDQYLNKNIMMVTIDGDTKVVPTAKVMVDTPYYKGEVTVMVLNNLICDLIIGNIPGAREKPNPKWFQRYTHQSRSVVNIRALEKHHGDVGDKEGKPHRRNRRFRRRPNPRRGRVSEGEGDGQLDGISYKNRGAESEGEEKDNRRWPQRKIGTKRRSRPALFIGGLPRSLRVSTFKAEVRGRDVDPLRVIWHSSNGHAFLQFKNRDLMETALKSLNRLEINGKKLRVAEADQGRRSEHQDGRFMNGRLVEPARMKQY